MSWFRILLLTVWEPVLWILRWRPVRARPMFTSRTMFELNKRYGWSKFIVVVPSIAIREGVKESFEITADHFMECYGKKARFFIYNSSNLNQLDSFSSNAGINVMIINMQALITSMKEGGKKQRSPYYL